VAVPNCCSGHRGPGRPAFKRQGQGLILERPNWTPRLPESRTTEQAVPARAAGLAATYLPLRRRWLRVAARWPRGRASVPHTGSTRAPPQPRPAHGARCSRRRPHTGLARGRRGLLNPDRTIAPGGGAQGGPTGEPEQQSAQEEGRSSPGLGTPVSSAGPP
jgi:hypothetical protein